MIDYLMTLQSKGQMQAVMPDHMRDGTWQFDHVFEVQAWFASTSVQRTDHWGLTFTEVTPVYDDRYWLLLSLNNLVPKVHTVQWCQLAWNRNTGQIYQNRLTTAEYAAITVEPMPMGAAYWLGRPTG